jgi:glycosyltransferase involved in cell wall biosynthesis
MTEELQKRIRPAFASRIEVVDRQCDVNTLLGGVCAAAVLAGTPGLVKSFPHSLIESLAAGKPVMVSRSIPMAEYVIREQCGVVVPSLEAGAFLEALQDLRENYRRYQSNALRVGRRDFSLEKFLGLYETLYRSPEL